MSRPDSGWRLSLDLSTKNTLNNLNHADGTSPLLCICGGSASGKTHFVNGLVRQLESIGLTALPLHCDNYYRSRYMPDPIAGFDTINAIDTEAVSYTHLTLPTILLV